MTWIDRYRAHREAHRDDCRVGWWFLSGEEVLHGGDRWPAHLCRAEVHTGAQLQQMKASRVVAGAVLLGPLGAVLGGVARVDKGKAFLAIETPTSSELVELDRKDEAAARRFALALARRATPAAPEGPGRPA